MPKTTPAAPAGLSPAAKKWWDRLTVEFAINDPAGELLLETALRCFDRAEQARKQLDQDGPTTTDSRGRPKVHPAASVERDSRSGMLQALKALHLDIEPLRDRPGRPGGS
jgi:P27 family predicted phage terminase small subunit